MSEPLLTLKQVAELLQIHQTDVLRGNLKGTIPGEITQLRKGQPRKYSGPAIMKWLEDNCPIVDQKAYDYYNELLGPEDAITQDSEPETT